MDLRTLAEHGQKGGFACAGRSDQDAETRRRNFRESGSFFVSSTLLSFDLRGVRWHGGLFSQPLLFEVAIEFRPPVNGEFVPRRFRAFYHRVAYFFTHITKAVQLICWTFVSHADDANFTLKLFFLGNSEQVSSDLSSLFLLTFFPEAELGNDVFAGTEGIAIFSSRFEHANREGAQAARVHSRFDESRFRYGKLLSNEVRWKQSAIHRANGHWVCGQTSCFIDQVWILEKGGILQVNTSLCPHLWNSEEPGLLNGQINAAEEFKEAAALLVHALPCFRDSAVYVTGEFLGQILVRISERSIPGGPRIGFVADAFRERLCDEIAHGNSNRRQHCSQSGERAPLFPKSAQLAVNPQLL